MDEIHWESLLLLAECTNIAKTFEDKMAKTSKSSSNTVDRYKHDMLQARNLQRKSKRSLKVVTAGELEDISGGIELALHGLEDAEALERKGSLKEALNIYELSIELLLKHLRSSPKKNGDFIAERIKVALSEAENLKAQISLNKSPRRSGNSDNPSKTCESMASILSSAISKMNFSSEKKRSPPAKNTLKRHSSLRTLSSPKLHSPTRQASLTNLVAPTSKRSDKPKQQQKGNPSRTNYENDSLFNQIKSDLYIDPSELQKTKWNDIAGLQRAKQSLQESAILPLIRPDLFQGLRKPQNILLYGPPGTGKTLLVKAVAHESRCLLFACSPSTLTSKWHGEGEKLVRTLFKLARDAAPSIIFVDEMDSLLSSRSDQEHEASRRFKTEFMVQMDGVVGNEDSRGNLLVVGCTNCPWNVDDAILRRFPRRLFIPLPDIEARKVLLESLLQKTGNHSLTQSQRAKLVNRLEGFSGSDMSSIASEASFGPIRSLGIEAIQKIKEQQLRPVSMQDFEKAVDQSTKSVSTTLLRRYDDWEQQQSAK